MFKVVAAGLVLSILNYGIQTATATGGGDFFQECPPSSCSQSGPEIRFPFRLNTSTPLCGAPGLNLSCSPHGDTILRHPILGFCNVSAIDYRYGFLNVTPLADSWSRCPLQAILSANVWTEKYAAFRPYPCTPASLVGCSTEVTPDWGPFTGGPISCLSNASQFLYLVSAEETITLLPSDCKVISKGIPIPSTNNNYATYYLPTNDDLALHGNEKGSVPVEMSFVFLDGDDNIDGEICQDCEQGGGRCGFNSSSGKPFCFKHHGSRVKVIAATSSVATFVVLLLLVITLLYRSLKRKYDEEIHMKVEMFLKTYGTLKPTRYTFAQVKKITRRFNDKLGQGGFGSVYKGELPNEVPVAVKMLENSIGERQEFINEVASIGRIHHANVVRLLGFCSEGTRHALIYEFMPNESLEKYIFSQDSGIQQLLVPGKMLEIALGIARGIEYLHQGCNQRILHFDIKPHNILLDYNFNPKISDFGLAKLCARDQSVVTLTTARGTMGYIAPELYSRNFGTVSYKSDVYSFGMLVLEMVSGKRNSDPWIENQNELYVPEWIYEKIVTGQELGVTQEMTQGERDTIRKLAIVALWCIQWNPVNRPSATKVVNMLSGNLQNLQMPPKPFVSSVSLSMPQT